nr:related to dolichyl-phosphate-mannose-glycolipid alpha-mannosyltransferase [Melanopsichium pennsylvanicum 4]
MTCLNPLKHKPIADSTKKKEKRLERAETQEASLLPTLEIIGEAANLVRTTARIGLISVTLALAVDTTYDCFANQAANRDAGPPRAILPALSLFSFLHKNVVANLSIFYGANPWHWYLTQGIPVLCTIWLPATLFGLITALQKKENGKGRAQTLARDATRSLARLACVTVGVYSLLGHKEFRFLQPLLPVLTILAASGLVASYADEKQNQLETTTSSTLKHLWHTLNMLPIWLRTVLLTFQPIAAMYLITMHGVGQEQIAYELGSIYRSQQQDASSNSSFSSSSGKGVVLEEQEFGQGFGKIHNLGFLMPCHSTPWATHLHDQELVERSWFIQCPPPPSTSEMTTKEREVGYWDQSDFFYHDPIKYLVERFPYNVDTDYPSVSKEYGKLTWIEGEGKGKDVWDKGWRHNWPSHLIMFDSLLREGTRKVGHTRTLKNLLSLKGYREVARYWNTIQHEDARRDGDVVVMAYKGPKSHG